MGIRPQNYHSFLFPALPQHLPAVLHGVQPETFRVQGRIIHLQKRPGLLRLPHQRLHIHRTPSVVGMPDDIHVRVLHRVHICLCHHFSGALSFIALGMHTGNGNIQLFQEFLREVHLPFLVEDIQFRPHKKLDSAHLSGYYTQILEIIDMACPRHLHRMVRDCKTPKPLFCRCRRHFLNGIVCMPAGKCMGMGVNFNFHKSSSFFLVI